MISSLVVDANRDSISCRVARRGILILTIQSMRGCKIRETSLIWCSLGNEKLLNLILRFQGKNCLVKWFSFACRKVLVLHFLRHLIGLKDSCYFFIHSEVQPKRIVTHSHAFSRALRQLPVITSSFDWFTVLSVSFVIG